MRVEALATKGVAEACRRLSKWPKAFPPEYPSLETCLRGSMSAREA
jgi:hypothetical protein